MTYDTFDASAGTANLWSIAEASVEIAVRDGDPFGWRSRWSVSCELARLIGLRPGSARSRHAARILRHVHPDDLRENLAKVHTALRETGPSSLADLRFRLSTMMDGERWCRFVGTILRDASGALVRVSGSLSEAGQDARDRAATHDRGALQTEWLRINAQHDAGLERFRQIAMNSIDGICCTDANGIVTFWNAACERLHGISSDEMVGCHIDRVALPEARTGDEFGAVASSHLGLIYETTALGIGNRRIPVEMSSCSWMENGQRCFGFFVRDITERKARERLLADLASRDALTGLASRAALTNHIEAMREDGRPFAVLMVDLDGFKDVNDTLGHENGDEVLKVVALRILGCIAPGDMAARFGGDEFTILVGGEDGTTRCLAIAQQVITALSQPIMIRDEMAFLGASIGMARAPEHGRTPSALLSSADTALYVAKGQGRGRAIWFAPVMRRKAMKLNASRRQIRDAIEWKEFELFYQPQYALTDLSLTGAEALLRWRHPVEGILTPDRFLSVLEGNPLAIEVGDWIIEEACRQAAIWRRARPSFRMGVNLFAAQLQDPALGAKVEAALTLHGLGGDALELEIPETVQLNADARLKSMLAQLKKSGVGIAFDDYGTGYASFSSLRDFPLTRLKIDRSFVQGMDASELDKAVVESILLLGRRLGVDVIAEGIETDVHQAALRAQGCLEGQGYLFGRPISALSFSQTYFTSP